MQHFLHKKVERIRLEIALAPTTAYLQNQVLQAVCEKELFLEGKSHWLSTWHDGKHHDL